MGGFGGCTGSGGIVYSSWILEFFLDTGLDPVTSFLSELDAENQKYRDVFGNADVLSAILMLISGALGLLITPPRRRLYVTGWIALAVFGIATIADASFPPSNARARVARRAHPTVYFRSSTMFTR